MYKEEKSWTGPQMIHGDLSTKDFVYFIEIAGIKICTFMSSVAVFLPNRCAQRSGAPEVPMFNRLTLSIAAFIATPALSRLAPCYVNTVHTYSPRRLACLCRADSSLSTGGNGKDPQIREHQLILLRHGESTWNAEGRLASAYRR